MAGSSREPSSPEVPFHITGTAQISSQKHRKSSKPKIHQQEQRGQNGNFCSGFPISAVLQPPNAQQPGLQLSKSKKKMHTPKKPNNSLPRKTQSFTQQNKFSLTPHCNHYIASRYFPPSPLRQKMKRNKNKPTLHSEGIDDLKPELQQGKYLKVFTPQLSFSGQGAFFSVSPFPYQHWSSLKPHFNFLA